MTRVDARDFLQLASENQSPAEGDTLFRSVKPTEALAAVKNDSIDGAAVIVP